MKRTSGGLRKEANGWIEWHRSSCWRGNHNNSFSLHCRLRGQARTCNSLLPWFYKGVYLAPIPIILSPCLSHVDRSHEHDSSNERNPDACSEPHATTRDGAPEQQRDRPRGSSGGSGNSGGGSGGKRHVDGETRSRANELKLRAARKIKCEYRHADRTNHSQSESDCHQRGMCSHNGQVLNNTPHDWITEKQMGNLSQQKFSSCCLPNSTI